MFRRKKNPCGISNLLLEKVTTEFLLEHSTNRILERIKITRHKLLKTLTLLRTAMTKDVPKTLEGIVEVDETYLGGQGKNKRLEIKRKSALSKRGRGTTKQPVFGILCRGGKVWAELIDRTEAENLQPIIERKVRRGSIVCSDTWRGYTGIAAKGYIHRMVEHSKNKYSDKKGNHINGLEGFWGYLKRKLSAKGGVRREKLHVYLGEYVWKYNHRNLTFGRRKNVLLKALFRYS
ncbi:MAG: IS1595 family transposase [Parcubacteria group bacterium]|nr:IS1595 family transposase [Parcubacteria group bacterium]